MTTLDDAAERQRAIALAYEDWAANSTRSMSDHAIFGAGYLAATEAAAKKCEARRDARFNEHGTREPDTNATYYRGGMAEECEIRDEEDDDCAAAIRGKL